MDLLAIILYACLAVLGLAVVWYLAAWAGLPDPPRKIILLVVAIIVVLWLLSKAGVHAQSGISQNIPAVESTPLAEPTVPPSTIPAVPVPPMQSPRAWLPVVFAGGECSEMAWYFCEVMQ